MELVCLLYETLHDNHYFMVSVTSCNSYTIYRCYGMAMSIIMLSDIRHSAQCQTESPQLSLPWNLFEGTSVREDQRPRHQPQAQRECSYWDEHSNILGEKWISRLAIANANFISTADNNTQQFVCCKPLLLPLQAIQMPMIQPYRQRWMKQRCHIVKGWTAAQTGGTEVHMLISTALLCSSHCPASGTAWPEQIEVWLANKSLVQLNVIHLNSPYYALKVIDR